MMTLLTVTTKGQVTLRKELLQHLGVAPGDKITVDLLPDGRAEIRSAKASGTIEDFFGCLAGPGTPRLSIEEINEATAAAWAGET
ncbi:AbrB/MazE/SpoVT family DNA-binding domain-containing protein [Inquilinus sp. Marseille-Q2685]|jgi:bifunctional DNA-binding transcriptional regulator/antitoxin component of YhaV-PrlF toxin-antitoxin module|uniref:AbrB/MazE/SpoVT family DNA-binding domain-containing protein n=1 Tax=Inquilinus sp. Marseille-Q2685 TaxID=2866581 RepID=UPI001CE3EE96|nr:AbrB/MazE/SpoVT family DNA-binding domain-containing protein [Inquilinus sp. Marseille-Q2685]